MRQDIIKLLALRGQEPVICSINKSIVDLKRAGYDRSEISDTIRDIFFGLDGKIDNYIISQSY